LWVLGFLFKIFPYMEHLRVVVHYIRFVERIFKINNELNNGIMWSFFDPSEVGLSRFDVKYKNSKNFKNIFFCFQKSITKKMPPAILSFLYHYDLQMSASKTISSFFDILFSFWVMALNIKLHRIFSIIQLCSAISREWRKMSKMPDKVFETNVYRLTWHIYT